MEKDYLIRAVDKDRMLRIIVADTTNLVQEAHHRHGTSATASAALGRVLTAAVMMGSDLKGENDILTIRIDGGGPAGIVIATANAHNQVRGLISNPQADCSSIRPGKLAVGQIVGRDGYVEVTKDLGLKQPFSGRTPLVSGEIAEDLVHYLFKSEQIPSLVSLGVLVAPNLDIMAAGGIIVQAMPESDDTALSRVEENVLKMGPITQNMQDKSMEEILALTMEGIPYEILTQVSAEFRCNCSQDRLTRILQSLPEEEVDSLFDENGQLEVVCNFCNEKYAFTPGSLKTE